MSDVRGKIGSDWKPTKAAVNIHAFAPFGSPQQFEWLYRARLVEYLLGPNCHRVEHGAGHKRGARGGRTKILPLSSPEDLWRRRASSYCAYSSQSRPLRRLSSECLLFRKSRNSASRIFLAARSYSA